MRRTAATALASVAQGAAVLVVVAALLPRLGSPAAIVSGAILLLLTRPLHRRLRVWLGEPLTRRDGEPLAPLLRRTLKLRYAAVDVLVHEQPVRRSESGAPEPVTTLTVEHRGARVGTLRLGPPLHGRRLTRARALADRLAPELFTEQRRLTAERRTAQLGHELHDRVGPSLAALKMLLHARTLSTAELADHADETAREVRRVLAELGPVGLDRGGLVSAVETLAARLAAGGGPAVTVESAGDLDALDPDVERALYAIAVEALNNVVTHAGARTCRVRLLATDRVRLIVEDDGVGMAPGAVAGLGSASMRRRARALGGELRVTSVAGTRVEAVL